MELDFVTEKFKLNPLVETSISTSLLQLQSFHNQPLILSTPPLPSALPVTTITTEIPRCKDYYHHLCTMNSKLNVELDQSVRLDLNKLNKISKHNIIYDNKL